VRDFASAGLGNQDSNYTDPPTDDRARRAYLEEETQAG